MYSTNHDTKYLVFSVFCKQIAYLFYMSNNWFNPSLMLGCVKIKSRKNVDGCPVFIAIATILMISEASAQNSVQPIIFPLWLLMMAFSIPSVCRNVRARTTEDAGNRETLNEYPLFRASSSLIPICANGGSINTAYWTGSRSPISRFCHRRADRG